MLIQSEISKHCFSPKHIFYLPKLLLFVDHKQLYFPQNMLPSKHLDNPKHLCLHIFGPQINLLTTKIFFDTKHILPSSQLNYCTTPIRCWLHHSLVLEFFWSMRDWYCSHMACFNQWEYFNSNCKRGQRISAQGVQLKFMYKLQESVNDCLEIAAFFIQKQPWR